MTKNNLPTMGYGKITNRQKITHLEAANIQPRHKLQTKKGP